jgi:hypothetical protein
MTPGSPQTPLVLTLPVDPSLARLTRLVALHLLRQNGFKVTFARRAAREVERRCRNLLRTPGGARGARRGRPLTLVLACRGGFLEVEARAPGAGRSAPSRIHLRLPAGP